MGVASGVDGVATSVTVQAYDVYGSKQIFGRDSLILRIENLCSISSATALCHEDSNSAGIPGLPLVISMTDNDDGTYFAEYTVSGGGGDISLSVTLQGLKAQWDDQ